MTTLDPLRPGKSAGAREPATRSFTNPREVLDALAMRRDPPPGPQVLVSDIRMPGGSGLQLLEKVREQPGLPVIIMTAYSDLDSAVSAFQRGAFEYLPKPFDLPKAVELIRRAVEESQREEVAEERQPPCPKCWARRRPCRTCSAPSAA
jgi:two-component system nitrogen regulation response regulator GlnG